MKPRRKEIQKCDRFVALGAACIVLPVLCGPFIVATTGVRIHPAEETLFYSMVFLRAGSAVVLVPLRIIGIAHGRRLKRPPALPPTASPPLISETDLPHFDPL